MSSRAALILSAVALTGFWLAAGASLWLAPLLLAALAAVAWALARPRSSPPSPAPAPAAGNLLSHVSHELRTPLAAARLYLGLVGDGLQGELNAEQKESLEGADRNLRQLEGMIANLIDATRLELGQVKLDLQPVDLAPLAASVLEAAGRHRDAVLVNEVPADLPPVLADPVLLRKVLLHLLDNAVKFSAAGATVRLAAAREGQRVRVRVVDSGVGITREMRPRIFDKLARTEELDDSSRKGLGLGLHLARDLVERQGGDIGVESEPGKGSTFYFTLPVGGDSR